MININDKARFYRALFYTFLQIHIIIEDRNILQEGKIVYT